MVTLRASACATHTRWLPLLLLLLLWAHSHAAQHALKGWWPAGATPWHKHGL
jgi:hypothetical protein